nr:unnamed protein product [Spirometra erinaceieuropaei]
MLHLFYVVVLIQLSYGCLNKNKDDNADTTTTGPSTEPTPSVKNNSVGDQNATDTTVSTKSQATSTLPLKETSASTDQNPVEKKRVSPTVAKIGGAWKDDIRPNPPVNNYSTGLKTSSSICPRLGLALFALSLAVVFYLF